ncbi:DUF3047 domain-containing protein [Hydrogenophaga sp. R2]|uniref:DUF3047 domain-containing protein n=1 Tax=Hydrogenophaga sp. R2 TaxID=3132827 RepID=UPI003CF3EE8C
MNLRTLLSVHALGRWMLGAGVLLLGACGTTPEADPQAQAEPARLLSTPWPELPWQPFPLPGKRYVPFEASQVDGRAALRVQADSSVSILRQRLPEPVGGLRQPMQLRLTWRVDALPSDGDLAHIDRSDSPVGVVLAFGGDRSRWTGRQQRLSDLTQLLTGEPLPYATLAYVWSAQHPVESVVFNPRTDRIRKLVLDSGTDHLQQWREHVRDVQADYRSAFGEEPGPLVGIALMTDTDNTRSRLTAWYGALSLKPLSP